MIKELIIHIGDTKTGSTSVQQVLAGRAYSIAEQSFAYIGKRNHNQLARSFVNPRFFERRDEIMARHARAYAKSDADYGVISAEHFQFADPKMLEEALRQHMPTLLDRVRVIGYVRPHHARLLSSYSQQVKAGLFKGTLEQYFKSQSSSEKLDYAPRFAQWQSVFGDRFMLRPYVRPLLYKQDTVSDFFRSILGHEQFSIESQRASNASMTVAQLALLRRVYARMKEQPSFSKAQKSLEFKAGRGTMGHLMAAYMDDHALGKDSGKLHISQSLGQALKSRFAADAERLDGMFFAEGTLGQALDLAAVEANGKEEQSLSADTYFDPQTLQAVDVFSDILSLMLTRDPDGFHALTHRMRRTFS